MMQNRKRSVDVHDSLQATGSSVKKILLDIDKENNLADEDNVPAPSASDEEPSGLRERIASEKQVSLSKQSKLRRSISVPNILNGQEQKSSGGTQRRATTTLVPGTLNESQASLGAWDSFDAGRAHDLVQTRKLFASTECSVCNQHIKFATHSRCSVCKLSFHVNCVQSMTIPCLPRKETPKSLANKGRLRLGDFCPDSRPMLPHLIGYCMVHLERTKIPQDLYHSFGDEAEATELLNNFKRRKTVPRLNGYSPATVAGCIKKFLTEIRDPLIPLSDGAEFLAALDSPEETLLELIAALPTPHCDTLVCLARHWKKMCDPSAHGSLNAKQLSDAVGPIVMGSHRPNSCVTMGQASDLLHRILSVPTDTFNLRFVDVLLDRPSIGRKLSQQTRDLNTAFCSSSNLLS